MKKKILLLSNSNIFSILVPLFLRDEYEVHLIHLRNQSHSIEEDYIFQFSEMYKSNLQKKGIVNNARQFVLGADLINKIHLFIDAHNIDLVFGDIQTLNSAESGLLKSIVTSHNIPVSVYIDYAPDVRVFEQLEELNIKGCVWSLHKEMVKETIKVQLNTIPEKGASL